MTRRKGTKDMTLRMAEDINDAERVSKEFDKFFITKIRGLRKGITPNGDDPLTRLNLHMKNSIRD